MCNLTWIPYLYKMETLALTAPELAQNGCSKPIASSHIVGGILFLEPNDTLFAVDSFISLMVSFSADPH